jgi:hypothetical protein
MRPVSSDDTAPGLKLSEIHVAAPVAGATTLPSSLITTTKAD